MSDQEQISQLSALFDGELPAQQAEMVIRRTLKDAAMCRSWERYALIGACLRGEPLVGANSAGGFAERVRDSLAAEAEMDAPAARATARPAGASSRFGSVFGRTALGGAIAAAVAVVSVFAVRSIGPATGDTGALVAQSAPVAAPAAVQPEADIVAATPAAVAVADRNTAPRSYTTPGENSPASNRLMDQPLAHYVVAHSELAASSFGYSSDLTQGAVEMTEDEIRARR